MTKIQKFFVMLPSNNLEKSHSFYKNVIGCLELEELV
jgi:hypothetical protein